MTDDDKHLVRELIGEVVDETVDRAVAKTLISLGFNARDPLQLQADMAYLAKLRRGAEEVKSLATSTTIKTCLGALIATFIYLVATRLGVPIKFG